MKQQIITTLMTLAFALTSSGEFEEWTNREGRTASMKLIDVDRKNDKIIGNFVLPNGSKVAVDSETLGEESAKRVREWTAPVASVFEEPLDGNLVILKGGKFDNHKMARQPNKYYVFYYTASWCPPCRQFTPRLVEFYNKNKNDNFEIILVSSDREANAQLDYAVGAKMPWPQIKFDEVTGFRRKFNHGVRGIPSVIVCNPDGTIVEGNFRDLETLKELVK